LDRDKAKTPVFGTTQESCRTAQHASLSAIGFDGALARSKMLLLDELSTAMLRLACTLRSRV
jgi:hypothetical protein